ncbi:hypothetical protein WN48_02953 [Eufriesea mexicana]|uniref:Uncharacterized protein n=1 Tax=Eufriesea mexicana TaxID=516756 RepID=A0A310SCV5_9HYME|nr:hypothetical protein WN48_02953 [Eufriesea mexicana]
MDLMHMINIGQLRFQLLFLLPTISYFLRIVSCKYTHMFTTYDLINSGTSFIIQNGGINLYHARRNFFTSASLPTHK